MENKVKITLLKSNILLEKATQVLNVMYLIDSKLIIVFCVHGHFFEDRRGGHSDGFLESPAFEANNGIVRQRPSEHNMINLLGFPTKRQQRNEQWHHILWHSHSKVN